jgi:hypothetical protein
VISIHRDAAQDRRLGDRHHSPAQSAQISHPSGG